MHRDTIRTCLWYHHRLSVKFLTLYLRRRVIAVIAYSPSRAMDEKKVASSASSIEDELKDTPKAEVHEAPRHIHLQFDTGHELSRFRTKWWQFWCVKKATIPWTIAHMEHCCRIPRDPPPPPRKSLDDAPVSSSAQLQLMVFCWYTALELGHPNRERVSSV